MEKQQPSVENQKFDWNQSEQIVGPGNRTGNNAIKTGSLRALIAQRGFCSGSALRGLKVKGAGPTEAGSMESLGIWGGLSTRNAEMMEQIRGGAAQTFLSQQDGAERAFSSPGQGNVPKE